MFKINTDKSVISESAGSSFINGSGVFDVSVNFASIGVSKSGAEQFVFNLDYKGSSQTIYGPYYKGTTANGGKFSDIAVGLYTTLGVIVGLTDGEQFTTEVESHKVGKEQKEVELDVIQELTDKVIKIQVQAEFSIYQGEIKENLVLRSFFREDGASAEEILNDGEVGKRLAMVEEKYASNVSYKDGITAEQATEWKANKRSGGSASSVPAAKTTAAKTGSLFKS
jgi:hypothetical protein